MSKTEPVTSPRLRGRVAAVTGAGSGLGLLIAGELLRQGARVVANHRSRSPGLEALRDVNPDALDLVAGDVGEERTARSIAERAAAIGRLDVLVHNAAITRDGALTSMSVEDWDEVLRVNLRGAFVSTKHALGLMVEQRYGRLIYLSSVVAVVGNAGQANYAASKAGLHGLALSVAQEYGSRGIRAVVLAPGILDVGLGRRLSQKTRDRKADHTLLGHGDSGSVAGTVAFLAGPEADFINATVVRSDGGIAF